MAFTITMITSRAGKTLGDIMGAYRVIQALCRDLLIPITVNFIIIGETPALQGLCNTDGNFIIAAPNNNIEFKVHLFDEQVASQEFDLSFKTKEFFLDRFTQFSEMPGLSNFLSEKIEKFHIERSKKHLINILTKDKYEILRASMVGADLMLVYNEPYFFLSILKLYSDQTNMPVFKNVWFISEYNRYLEYQQFLQQTHAYSIPPQL